MAYNLYSLNNEFRRKNSSWPSGLFTGIVESENGSRFWILNGLRSRIDGPAIILYDGTQIYCVNDKCHKIGGPAVIRTDGTKEYWINDKQVTELEHNLLCGVMKLKGLLR